MANRIFFILGILGVVQVSFLMLVLVSFSISSMSSSVRRQKIDDSLNKFGYLVAGSPTTLPFFFTQGKEYKIRQFGPHPNYAIFLPQIVSFGVGWQVSNTVRIR
jgi:hypothetical protein